MKKFKSISEKISIVSIVLFVAIGIMFFTSNALSQYELTDRNIKKAVIEEFKQAPEVSAENIDVSISDGIVTLTGTADNLLAKERAVPIAETVRGVRSIINQIDVKAVSRSDKEISKDLDSALREDPATKTFKVNTKVTNGKVSLTGTVDSWQEKQLAANIAKSVSGINSIENNITVEYQKSRNDSEIESDVKQRLKWDPWINTDEIDVNAENGVVTLTGKTASLSEKSRASIDAWVMGTKAVNTDNLAIDFSMTTKMEREMPYTEISDDQVRDMVLDAFIYDPRVFVDKLDVTVNDGVVKLSGEVDNLMAKKAAERDARNTLGVWKVTNNLDVNPNQIITDKALVNSVKNALERDSYIEPFEINVRADEGTVILSGTVNNAFEKRQAENVADRVLGVMEVENNIEQQYASAKITDPALKQGIENQLVWSPYVDESTVNIAVENGIVTLSGTVNSWAARIEAEKNAYEAGAKNVKNDIRIAELPMPSNMIQ